MVERLLAQRRRVCVLDPVGVWWGLRANAKGDGPGFEVAVVGGEHDDMALSRGMGAALGRAVGENNLPLVVDTSEMGVAERNRFLRHLLAELYRVNRAALWLVLEEADEAAPRVPRSDGGPQLLDAVDRIARRGRSRGFRLFVVSQRPQVVHKNVLTQVRTRFTAPLDVRAVEDWMKANSEPETVRRVVSTLPGLDTGEAWVWSPEEGTLARHRMPPITTFDSSSTPDADAAPVEPVGLAAVDLSAFEAAGDGGGATRAKDAQVAPSAAALAEAEARGYARGLAEGRIQGAAEERARIVAAVQAALAEENRSPEPPKARPAPSKPRSDVGTTPTPAGDTPLPRAGQAMFDFLDADPPFAVSWTSLAAVVVLRPTGGHFNSVRKALRNSGLVEEGAEGARVRMPSAAAESPPPRVEIMALVRRKWREMLGGRAADILELLEMGPSTWTALAARLGVRPTGGHWNAVRKPLRDYGLVVETGGTVRLAPELGG